MCLGIPGRVVEIVDAQQQRVMADVDGVRREVSVALLGVGGDEPVFLGEGSPDEAVTVGDWVLIHVGFAMSKIDEQEAAETLRALKALGDPFEQELGEFSADGAMDPFVMLADELPPTAPSPSAGAPPPVSGPLGDPTALPPPADGHR
jgi:hydrogenase expression/formation protein HypC